MELNELYKIAEEKGIKVMDFPLPQNRAVTISTANGCYVGVDPAVFGREWEEKLVIAHEMGHIATGSFYNNGDNINERKLHEARVHRWVINRLVPENELKAAVKNGCSDTSELAEIFGIPESFMAEVLKYYSEK